MQVAFNADVWRQISWPLPVTKEALSMGSVPSPTPVWTVGTVLHLIQSEDEKEKMPIVGWLLTFTMVSKSNLPCLSHRLQTLNAAGEQSSQFSEHLHISRTCQKSLPWRTTKQTPWSQGTALHQPQVAPWQSVKCCSGLLSDYVL